MSGFWQWGVVAGSAGGSSSKSIGPKVKIKDHKEHRHANTLASVIKECLPKAQGDRRFFGLDQIPNGFGVEMQESPLKH